VSEPRFGRTCKYQCQNPPSCMKLQFHRWCHDRTEVRSTFVPLGFEVCSLELQYSQMVRPMGIGPLCTLGYKSRPELLESSLLSRPIYIPRSGFHSESSLQTKLPVSRSTNKQTSETPSTTPTPLDPLYHPTLCRSGDTGKVFINRSKRGIESILTDHAFRAFIPSKHSPRDGYGKGAHQPEQTGN